MNRYKNKKPFWGKYKCCFYLLTIACLILNNKSRVCGQTTFGPQQVICPKTDGASDVYAADLNGDGSVDVLSASVNDDKIAW